MIQVQLLICIYFKFLSDFLDERIKIDVKKVNIRF
jgi:hypothetical protein